MLSSKRHFIRGGFLIPQNANQSLSVFHLPHCFVFFFSAHVLRLSRGEKEKDDVSTKKHLLLARHRVQGGKTPALFFSLPRRAMHTCSQLGKGPRGDDDKRGVSQLPNFSRRMPAMMPRRRSSLPNFAARNKCPRSRADRSPTSHAQIVVIGDFPKRKFPKGNFPKKENSQEENSQREISQEENSQRDISQKKVF